MSDDLYPLANLQTDHTPTKGFSMKTYLDSFPAPSTHRGDYAGRATDPAFQWRRIPEEFKHETRIYTLRKRYQDFQFEFDNPKVNWMPTREDADHTFNIRVRRNPHTV